VVVWKVGSKNAAEITCSVLVVCPDDQQVVVSGGQDPAAVKGDVDRRDGLAESGNGVLGLQKPMND
jgi:hypothetical protein